MKVGVYIGGAMGLDRARGLEKGERIVSPDLSDVVT